MTNVIAVFDGFGSLLTIIRADTKHQLSCALDDFADEYLEGCCLQEPITDRDWDAIGSAFEGGCISILCDISGDNQLEIKGVPLRDYTHFPKESEAE